MIILSFQTLKSIIHLRNAIYDILDENREACDCPIDCQVNYTVKVQKSMKSRVVTVALTTASPVVVGCHRGCVLPPAVVHVTSHTL